MIQLVDKRNRLEPKIFKISKLVKIQSHLYIKVTFGTTKHGHYRQVVAIQKHCKYWLLNKMVIIYRFSKKVSHQIGRENYLGWNQTFIKFVEAANNLTKLVQVGKLLTKLLKFDNKFTKFVEFANEFTKFVGLSNNFFEVRKSYKQLYKVRATRQ